MIALQLVLAVVVGVNAASQSPGSQHVLGIVLLLQWLGVAWTLLTNVANDRIDGWEKGGELT